MMGVNKNLCFQKEVRITIGRQNKKVCLLNIKTSNKLLEPKRQTILKDSVVFLIVKVSKLVKHRKFVIEFILSFLIFPSCLCFLSYNDKLIFNYHQGAQNYI